MVYTSYPRREDGSFRFKGVKLEVIHKGFMAVKIGPSVNDCVR